jgi:hypothetical protein
MLLNPNETQFATNFMMVEWLFKWKPIIKQVIIDLEWTTFVNTLCGTHHQKVPHQGEIRLNQHKEGLVLGHLCQLCAHGGTGLNCIEGIQWQTTYHGEVMVCFKTLKQHVLSL